jgi:hypothetical protein
MGALEWVVFRGMRGGEVGVEAERKSGRAIPFVMRDFYARVRSNEAELVKSHKASLPLRSYTKPRITWPLARGQ